MKPSKCAKRSSPSLAASAMITNSSSSFNQRSLSTGEATGTSSLRRSFPGNAAFHRSSSATVVCTESNPTSPAFDEIADPVSERGEGFESERGESFDGAASPVTEGGGGFNPRIEFAESAGAL